MNTTPPASAPAPDMTSPLSSPGSGGSRSHPTVGRRGGSHAQMPGTRSACTAACAERTWRTRARHGPNGNRPSASAPRAACTTSTRTAAPRRPQRSLACSHLARPPSDGILRGLKLQVHCHWSKGRGKMALGVAHVTCVFLFWDRDIYDWTRVSVVKCPVCDYVPYRPMA